MDIIKAVIWLKSNEAENRSHPKGVGWCPHLCLASGHNDADGRPLYMGVRLAEFGEAETVWLNPGECREVVFQLLFFDPQTERGISHYQPLQLGREFEIREGARTVGYGCVQSRHTLASE